jgi:hypothetical protein
MKTLIACPGLRDPFWSERRHVRDAQTSIWMEEVAARQPATGFDVKALQEFAYPGPLLTALLYLRDCESWSPDRLLLAFAPSDDMNPRIAMCQRLYGRLDIQIELIRLENVNVAQYGSAYNGLKRGVEEYFRPGDDGEWRILTGPGTPQLNLGLIALPYNLGMQAELFQALDPSRVHEQGVRLETVLPRYLTRLEFDGESMPRLRIEDGVDPEVVRLGEMVEALQSENHLLAAKLQEAEIGGSSEDSLLPLEGEVLQMERRRTAAAIAREREAAAGEGRRATKERAAQLLGLKSRQALDRVLQRTGLTW